MEQEELLLLKFKYDRAKSEVDAEWNTMEVNGEDVKFPVRALRGTYMPSDNIIETLDAFKPILSQLLGTDRDVKGSSSQKAASNHTAHLQDITVKQVKVARNSGDPTAITVTGYLRGPLGRGTAINFTIKVNSEEQIGIEEELLALTSTLAMYVGVFIETNGKQQGELFEPGEQEG